MANSTPAGCTIFYDNSGGTPVDITPYVLNINDIDVESITEQTNPFGVSWEEHKAIGVGRIGVIEFGGLYDDTATTGPNALFSGRVPELPATATRTFTFTFLSGKSVAFETRLLTYRRSPDRGALTKYTVRLQPTGAAIEV